MPNRTNPEFWKDDVALNSLSRDAELLFYKLQHVREDNHRFPIIPSPQKPRNLHAALYYLRVNVRLTDVALWLDEIQKAGAIVVRDSERGWYGEIAERWRYVAEDYQKGVPRYGPRAAKTERVEQGVLPLPPMGLMPAARMPAEKSKPSDYDSDHGNDPNHRPAGPARPVAMPPAAMNRSAVAGRESGNPKFARTFAQITGTPVGKRLFDFIGPVQMSEEARSSGANWLKLIEEEGELLESLIEQGQRTRSTDERLATGKGRAQFLTLRIYERKTA